MPVAVEDDDATGEQRAAGLRYEESGEGPDLVLLHGFGGCLEHWNPVVGKLATERHVVAVDLPGFGRSERWGRGRRFSIRHLVDRVEAFLDAVGLEAPAVAGNSLGGVVALELAKRRRASSVIVLSPAAFIDGASKLYVAGMLGGLQGIARSSRARSSTRRWRSGRSAGPSVDSWCVVPTISTRASCDRQRSRSDAGRPCCSMRSGSTTRSGRATTSTCRSPSRGAPTIVCCGPARYGGREASSPRRRLSRCRDAGTCRCPTTRSSSPRFSSTAAPDVRRSLVRSAALRSLRSVEFVERLRRTQLQAAGQQAGLVAAGEGATAPSRTPDGVATAIHARTERAKRTSEVETSRRVVGVDPNVAVGQVAAPDGRRRVAACRG